MENDLGRVVTEATKSCPTCGGTGPFSKDASKKDGLSWECQSCAKLRTKAWRASHPGRNSLSCKAWAKANPEQKKANFQQWYARNRDAALSYARRYAGGHQDARRSLARGVKFRNRALVNSLKEGQPCTDCGRTHPTYCMDFDHVRGEKKGAQLSDLYGCSRSTVLAEIAKCKLVCVCCHRIRTEERKSLRTLGSARRREFRAKLNILKSGPCTDCGLAFDPRAMEFDHVRGTKVLDVSCMRHSPWDEVVAEIAKCDLVCAVCHRKRTEARRCHSH